MTELEKFIKGGSRAQDSTHGSAASVPAKSAGVPQSISGGGAERSGSFLGFLALPLGARQRAAKAGWQRTPSPALRCHGSPFLLTNLTLSLPPTTAPPFLSQLKAQAQGNSEELRCLLLLNRVQDLEELVGNQSCLKLAGRIKDYVATVMKDMNRIQQETSKNLSSSSDRQLADRWPGSRPSAHLTLGRQRTSQPGSRGLFGELQQSCQHPVYQWKNATMHAHLQNVTYLDGKLQVHQPGRYYVYAQIYFRYPTESAHVRSSSRQLVQCVNLQSSYGQNSLLLKGVGTKCWAQDATYGLYALYQGGLFDLKAGDKLFVSVSSLDINYNDEAGSYFGAFRLPG
nr:tumor necrosis factor ligand superfamily member 10-like [Pogona vitticeps]